MKTPVVKYIKMPRHERLNRKLAALVNALVLALRDRGVTEEEFQEYRNRGEEMLDAQLKTQDSNLDEEHSFRSIANVFSREWGM